MRAVSVPLADVAGGGDVDLNDVCAGHGALFVRAGTGFAGRGVAWRGPADDALRVMHDVEHDDRAGGATLRAIGCVPFLPGAPAQLSLPRVTVVKDAGGHHWVTAIGDDPDALLAEPLTDPRPAPASGTFDVAARGPVEQYLAAVERARDAVRRGELAKAVIARQVEVRGQQPIDVHGVLLRLKAAFSTSYRYCVDGLVGASPELLVSVDADVVRSRPLAGTAPRTGDPDTDRRAAAALVASTKDQVEHRVVIDMIHDTLLPWCSYLDWEPEPSVVAVANVQHLATYLEGRLSDPAPTVLQLVRALCPTPALGGFPRNEAIRLIQATEGFDRGRYGGAVGWIDHHGNGEWAVTIRCAELSDDRRTAVLTAGGGIVAQSEPLAELAETQAKFQAMLSAIVRP